MNVRPLNVKLEKGTENIVTPDVWKQADMVMMALVWA